MEFKIGDKVKVNQTYFDNTKDSSPELSEVEWVVTGNSGPLWPVSATPIDKESQYFGLKGFFHKDELDLVK